MRPRSEGEHVLVVVDFGHLGTGARVGGEPVGPVAHVEQLLSVEWAERIEQRVAFGGEGVTSQGCSNQRS